MIVILCISLKATIKRYIYIKYIFITNLFLSLRQHVRDLKIFEVLMKTSKLLGRVKVDLTQYYFKGIISPRQ